MAKFELVDYSIISKNATIAPQTVGEFNGSIGDEIEITLNYSFDEILTGELWYNIGLFVEENQDLVNSDEMPDSGFYRTLSLGTTTAQNMSLRGVSASEKNGTATIQKTGDSLFTIVHTLFLTEDLNDWLANSGYENTDRFLQSSTSELDQFQETVDSAYQGNTKTLGFLVAINRPITTTSTNNGEIGSSGGAGIYTKEYTADSPIFAVNFEAQIEQDKLEIFVNNVLTATTTFDANGNFGDPSTAGNGFDGNSGNGWTLGLHPDPPTINDTFYVGTSDVAGNYRAVPERLTEYRTDTADQDTVISVKSQLIWVKGLANGDIVTIRVAGSGTTIWSYSIIVPESVTQEGGVTNLHSYIPVELQFVQEDSTNRLFNLTRSGTPETELSTLIDTDIEIKVDFSTLVLSKIRYSLLNITNDNNSTNFITNYEANFADTPAPTQLINTFTTNVVIPFSAVKADNQYRIYCVGYDEAGNEVRAWCSDVLNTTGINNICPTIASNIDLYDNSYTGYHLQLSTVQRVKAKLEITEAGTDVSNLTLNVDGNVLTAFKSGSNWITNDTDWNITQVGSVISSEYNFRVLPDWSGLTKDLIYNITFGTENETFTQRFEIEQNEQDKGTADLTDQKIFFGGNEVSDFCDLGASDFAEMQTTKDAAYDARQTFHAWNNVKTDIIEEEVWVGGVLPQLSASGVQNVDENFTTNIASAEFAPNQILKQFVGVVTFENINLDLGFYTFGLQSPNQLSVYHQITEIDSFSGATLNLKFITENDLQFRLSVTTTFTGGFLTFTQLKAETGVQNKYLEISATSLGTNYDAGGILYVKLDNVPVLTKTVTNVLTDDIIDINDLIPVTNEFTLNTLLSTNTSTKYSDFSELASNASDYTNMPVHSTVGINAAIQTLADDEIAFFRPSYGWTDINNYGGQIDSNWAHATREYLGHFSRLQSSFRDFTKGLALDGVNDYVDYVFKWSDYIFIDKPFTMIMTMNYVGSRTSNWAFVHVNLLSSSVTEYFQILMGTNFCFVHFRQHESGVTRTFGDSVTHNAGLWKNKVNTVVVTYEPDAGNVPNVANLDLYLNGIKISTTMVSNSYYSASPRNWTVQANGLSEYSNNNNEYLYMQHTWLESILLDVKITEAEAYQHFVGLTSDTSKYAANYPANLMNNRVYHWNFNDAANYTENAGVISVTDQSGNGNDGIVQGQTTTPNLIPISV